MCTYNFNINLDNQSEAIEIVSCLQPFFYEVDIKVHTVENNWILSLSTEEHDENFCEEALHTILKWLGAWCTIIEKAYV